jgi:hypothetical protein
MGSLNATPGCCLPDNEKPVGVLKCHHFQGFPSFTSTVQPVHPSFSSSVGGLPLVPTRRRLHLCLLSFKVVIFAFH